MAIYRSSIDEQSLSLTGWGADRKQRGVNVYTMSQLIGVAGRAKDGSMVSGTVDVPYFGLDPETRVQIYNKCDIVLGLLNGRANRISTLEWTIGLESQEMDQTADSLKMLRQIFMEHGGNDPKSVGIRIRCLVEIRRVLPDVNPDLSNFTTALIRYNKMVNTVNKSKQSEIEGWLLEPNQSDSFEDYIKKWVLDLHIHGSFSQYKQFGPDKILSNIYALPGGSVVPMKGRFVGGPEMFFQVMPGAEYQAFFRDEISYCAYMPTTAASYGNVPMDALVNKVAESLLFDQLAASQADGTKLPEKLVVMGEASPFGDISGQGIDMPMSAAKRSRIEEVMNTPRQGAVKVLTGQGTPVILDLSRADTFAQQNQRQKDIRECVAIVWNATNQEMNLTGSESLSGRETSETQYKLEREKGVYPITRTIQRVLTREILPFRYGFGYNFQFKASLSEWEQAELDTKKNDTRTYSINEIRIARGDEPFADPRYDMPDNTGPVAPDGSESKPLSVRSIM